MAKQTQRKTSLLIDSRLTPSLFLGMSTIPVKNNHKVNLTINLRSIPLLSKLSAADMDRVKGVLSISRYSRRNVILQQGTASDNLFLLLSGRLQLIDLNNEGKVIGLDLLSPGNFLGETSLINQTTWSSSVVALTDVLVALLPRKTALYLFSHAPSVASQIQRHLAEKIQRDYKFRSLLSINNTAKRIVNFLVFMKQKTSEQVELVENMPTHQDIANMINTSRETVTRTLLTLMQQGIIRKDSRRLIIVNPGALQELMHNKQISAQGR